MMRIQPRWRFFMTIYIYRPSFTYGENDHSTLLDLLVAGFNLIEQY